MTERVKIILAFCFSITILIITGIYSIISTSNYRNASDWVTHTHIVISVADSVLVEVQDIETAQRGYVVTGDEKFLDPYIEGLKKIGTSYAYLKYLTSDNPRQQILLDTIHSVINSKIEFAKKVINVRKEEGFTPAEQLMLTGSGEAIMRNLRGLLSTFNNNENVLRTKRFETAKRDFNSAIRIISLSLLLTIAIVLTTLYFYIKDHNNRITSEKKVIASESRIKKFMDGMPVGIFIVAADGKPYYANAKAKDILGKGILPGSNVAEFPEIYKALIAGTNNPYPPNKLSIARALKGEKDILVDDLEVLKGNTRVPLRINTTYITDNENKIEFALAVIEDITQVKAAEKELIEARKLAEQSGLLKEAFLANMSHEIRTPMNAILGFTNILLKKNFPESEKEKLQTIKTSGETLLRIINDILDVSKIESGMMTFEQHPISIKEIFASLKSMLSTKAEEKNIRLSFEYENSLPDTVMGDPTRLTQIIINLVGNAIKFTDRGGKVDVFAKILTEKNGIYTIGFSVTDTGIGIAEDKLQQVFERFRQAESTTTRQYGGTGLGLSIAKQLVNLQGGDLTVKSKVGEGSVFSFTLPFMKTDGTFSKKNKQQENFDINELNTYYILVAEDNPINIKFILTLFDDYAIKPDLAKNGKEAVVKVKNKKYDLVLMDIEMPEMNGYEATTAIRNELKSNVPIIAMTAHAMSGEKEKCLSLGMNDYISKPIDADLLFEKIFIATHPQSADKNSIQKTKIINLAFLIKSMRGKKEVINETINIFLEQIPEELSAIDEAIAKADFNSIRKSTHRMKSTVSLMGINAMEKILEEMELLASSQTGMDKITTLGNSLNLLSKQAIDEIQIEKLNYS